VPAPKKYPEELRDRAVRLVFQIHRERGSTQGVIPEVARRLGIGDQSLRTWVKQADIDDRKRPGTTSADATRIAELERENRELRRSNEILKAASAFFARELDPRPPR
jgi:transposase